jgi:hypothetical protein
MGPRISKSRANLTSGSNASIPKRLVLTEQGAEAFVRHLNKPNTPTKAMRALMAGKFKEDPPN